MLACARMAPVQAAFAVEKPGLIQRLLLVFRLTGTAPLLPFEQHLARLPLKYAANSGVLRRLVSWGILRYVHICSIFSE